MKTKSIATPPEFLALREDAHSEKGYPSISKALAVEIDSQIGEGSFGLVFKARDLEMEEIVVLMKVLTDHKREGFPIMAGWEIKILQQLLTP